MKQHQRWCARRRRSSSSSSSRSGSGGSSCRWHQRRRVPHGTLGDIWRLTFDVERFVPQHLFRYVRGRGNDDAVISTKRDMRLVAQSHQARVEICFPRSFALFLRHQKRTFFSLLYDFFAVLFLVTVAVFVFAVHTFSLRYSLF